MVVWTADAGHGRHLAESLRKDGYSVRAVTSQAAMESALSDGADLLVAELADCDLALVAFLAARCPMLFVAIPQPQPDSVTELVTVGAYDVLASPLRAVDVRLALHKAQAREASLGDRTAGRFLPSPLPETKSGVSLPGVIAESKVMQSLLAQVARVAVHPTSVLLLGESGTGKEVLAKAVHQLSPRRDKPFVAINCGALPAQLLESLLFGHVQGAFTDAIRDQQGVFQRADGGTLFLDEIGELPQTLQVKLLRALQEQKILPLGARDEISVDVRVIAATLRNLSREVDAGRFRADLYYRLSVVELVVPPLRERTADILPLAQHFLRKAAQRLARPVVSLSDAAQKVLLRFPFPGNVRELENLIERAVVLCERTQLDVADLPYEVVQPRPAAIGPDHADPSPRDEAPTGDLSIKAATARLERELIARALHKTAGNRAAAARMLELSHRALLYKLREYGLDEKPASKPTASDRSSRG